jgi:ribonuclease P protein component
MTAGDLATPLLGRIVRPADYVRVLATPMRLRSPHFAVHHLDGRPLPLKRPTPRATGQVDENGLAPTISSAGSAPDTASLSTELSTGGRVTPPSGVDDLQDSRLKDVGEYPDDIDSAAPVRDGVQRWLGLVVPKRHAKRAVTRTLVKRQIRTVAAACAPELAPGLWVVRQRSPFDPKQYPSAASDALKEAARAELSTLFERAVRGERDRVKPRSPSSEPLKGSKAAKSGSLKAAGAAVDAAPPPPASPEGTPCAA